MNNFLVGQHGSGKSVLGVMLCIDKEVPVYLIAASPNQLDKKTGRPTFPASFRRTSVDKLVRTVQRNGRPELAPAVKNCCILVDDNTDLMDNWKLYRPLLKEFRQYGLDIYMTAHTWNHLPSKLIGYGTRFYAFRTNSKIPYSSVIKQRKEIEAAEEYILKHGDEHSFLLVDNTKGTIEVVLKWQ